MSLLVLRYHRGRAGRRGNPVRLLNAHFAHIAYCCANRMPGEPLAPGMTNICLSFDGGYYDFYALVYPLLLRHDLRALLAVAPYTICEYVDARPEDRLALETEAALADPRKGGFCTWSELGEMTASGHVTLAVRGRPSAGRAGRDAPADVDAPRQALAARFAGPVESYVLADGKSPAGVLDAARHRYRFLFGNGGASNRGWSQPLLYRIDADELASPSAPFSPLRRAHYRARYWWNRLRER